MLIGKFQIHKPAPLMLFAMMVGFSVLIPASAVAADTFLRKPALDDYMDGDVTVARPSTPVPCGRPLPYQMYISRSVCPGKKP